MFQELQAAPADAILSLIVEYKNDPRPEKIDLGVGVFKTALGETPVLEAVKEAERRLVKSQSSKAYIGSAGAQDFNVAMSELTYADTLDSDRLASLQTPGGSGSLRVAAGRIQRCGASNRVWVGEPTWANHIPLLGGAGLELKMHAYYDSNTHKLREADMLEALSKAPIGDMVLLHACCHNPSGIDPTEEQWRAIADVIVERDLVPFIDMAYQGFGSDLDTDAFVIRHLAERVEEMIVCNSCSKNFGLYRDRVGALSFLTANAKTRDIVQSQANNVVRTMYSMPPDHGAAVVSIILHDEALRAQWVSEVEEMRERIFDMRTLLVDTLRDKAPDHDFSHLAVAKGMFCFLGVSAEQVEQLKKEHGIYMVNSSRINVAGITAGNVEYLASSIASVL